MTREDIIRMAREAGFLVDEFNLVILPKTNRHGFHAEVERFAELVRKDYSFTHAQMWLKRLDDAVKAEREACAKVCDDLHDTFYDEDNSGECAAAIRARGETTSRGQA